MELYPDGIQACSFGCLGGGSCIAVCKKDAISIGEAGVAQVDRDLCRGCGLCVKWCPMDAIEVIDGRAWTDFDLCIACGMRSTKCPRNVIWDADGVLVKG